MSREVDGEEGVEEGGEGVEVSGGLRPEWVAEGRGGGIVWIRDERW